MKTVLKIALGMVLGAVVLIGGCVALIGGGLNEAQQQSDEASITQSDYRSVTRRTSRAQVERRFGEPQSADEVDQEIPDGAEEFIEKGTEDLACIYYNRRGELASIYQFCFDGNGKLTSKSSI